MMFFVAVLVVLSIFSSKLSSKFGLPLLIGFILIGLAVGSDVLKLVYFDDVALAKSLAEILLVFIIFEGGFRITQDTFRQISGPSMTLATLGVLLTAGILGIIIHLTLRLDLAHSFLISSIISSTDAAAVFMITKASPIKRKLAATLSVESAANDPMAILLTLTFVQVLTSDFGSPVLAVLKVLWQFAGGLLIAFVCFKLSKLLLGWLRSDNRGNYSVLAIGCILFAYGLSELAQANGIIAVFFLGYWLGNASFPGKRGISNFLESISTISNIVIFILLGLLAFPSRFVLIWKEALLIVVAMMFVARPLAVLLSTIPFRYSLKEKAFLMWGGIKGAVPIVLATYPLAAGIDQEGFVFDSIFFAVFVSCLVQGTTLAPLSRLLKFTEQKKPESAHVVELHSLEDSDMDMFETHVEDGSYCIGKKLSELNLGQNTLISSIVRKGHLILPKGNTEVHSDDILFILTKTELIGGIQQRLVSGEAPKPEETEPEV